MSDGRRRNAAFADLDILLSVEDEGWLDLLPDEPEALVRRAVEAALAGSGLPPDLRTELGVTLADDDAVAALNGQWRNKHRPTNILSFPTRPITVGQTPGPLAGDLVLAGQTCAREAQEQGKTVGDHVTHLLVHGVLHLLGHDHLDDEEAGRMEALEVEILSGLSIGDPYGEPEEAFATADDGR